MSKKIKIILYLIGCVALFLGGIYLMFGGFTARQTSKEKETVEHGELLIEDETVVEQPDGAEDMNDNLTVDDINLIGYYDIVDLFTVSALDRMYPEIRNYLDLHGYADAFNLTIDEDSIISDRGYPRFLCQIENTESYLEVRYDISKGLYEFQITK